MGMYDEVFIRCPVCHNSFDFQSKAGPCDLKTFSLDNAPLRVLDDILQDSKQEKFYCKNCGAKLKLRVLVQVQLKAADDIEPDGWREAT